MQRRSMTVDEPSASADVCRRVPRWIPRRAGTRLGCSATAGIATYALAVSLGASRSLALGAAWDAFSCLPCSRSPGR
jgi:hypothetical protein